jgi:dihydroorotase
MSNLRIFPGFIDPHVHFREPGLEHKETMATGAAAAFAGGVTTVCEMPNTNPPTVTIAAFADKVRRAANVNGYDIRFFFGITEAIHLFAFREMMGSDSAEMRRLRARCSGVKLYLDHSTGNQKVDGGIVPQIFEACSAHDVVLVAHCEDPEINANAAAQNTRTDVAAHTLMRPSESEAASIEYALSLVRQYRTRFHVAHLTTLQGIDLVRRAKAEGLPVTCEVTPNHLFLTTDDYETLGTRMKMNPPIRSRDHQEALWEGIADGTVDIIATDHAPHTIEEKTGADVREHPLRAPSGIPGVETRIPLLLSVAAGHWPHPRSRSAVRSFAYDDLVRTCFTNPNTIFRLSKKMPEEGGDTVTIDLNAEWIIEGSKLHSKCGWTPYEGWKVKGKIVETKRAH